MKRVVLLILVLLVLMDLAEDGQFGKSRVCFGHSPVKITSTSSDQNPGPGHIDLRYVLASSKAPENLLVSSFRPAVLHLPQILRIMHCCHLSSAGGNPR